MSNKPMPHPHAELIKAWADGAKIQSRYLIDFDNVEQWSKWTDDDEPEWCDDMYQFRVKPKKPTNKRVKAALKGTTDVSGNVGSNVGSPELDSKPLTDGEIALIKALRKTWGFAEILKPGDAVVVSKNKNGVYKSTTHNISILLIDGEGSDAEIVEALELINEEHKIDNERALRDLDIKAGQILRDVTK